MKFSANLGFLWTDRPLPEAIHAARAAGFDAVECHWPYDTPLEDVLKALQETGLQMLGLNTRRGDTDAGENGLTALPGREGEAKAAIDEALAYGSAIGAANVHVMAGFAAGPEAGACFIANLEYACDEAAKRGMTILIEPLNRYNAPGYFLSTTAQALSVIEAVERDNLKLMFDCYHVQLMEGDLSHKLEALMPKIGHIQFAGVPSRGVPTEGEVNYTHVFAVIAELGYEAPLGAEYLPSGATDDSLTWMQTLGSI